MNQKRITVIGLVVGLAAVLGYASLDQSGPWSEVPLKYDGLIRHGCVIRIGEEVYRGLLAFPTK